MAKAPHRPRGQKQKVADLRRGEIYLCSFDPTVGHEIKKTRPALIIQNDVGNRYSPLTIVAAITSTVSPVPYPVAVVTLAEQDDLLFFTNLPGAKHEDIHVGAVTFGERPYRLDWVVFRTLCLRRASL